MRLNKGTDVDPVLALVVELLISLFDAIRCLFAFAPRDRGKRNDRW